VSELRFLEVSQDLKRKVQARLIAVFQEEMQKMQSSNEHKTLEPTQQMLANSECTDWFQYWYDRLPGTIYKAAEEFEEVDSLTPAAGYMDSFGSLLKHPISYFSDSLTGLPHYVSMENEMTEIKKRPPDM